MAIEPTDPLQRALEAARADEPEGWIELSESIMSRVRSLVTPSEPIVTYSPAGEPVHDAAGSRTLVSARVVTAALRRLLQGAPSHAPEKIRLQVEDEHLTGVELALVCAYGVDLVVLADQIRRDVLLLLTDLLGPDPTLGMGSVDIEISDVVEGDPNLV